MGDFIFGFSCATIVFIFGTLYLLSLVMQDRDFRNLIKEKINDMREEKIKKDQQEKKEDVTNVTQPS